MTIIEGTEPAKQIPALIKTANKRSNIFLSIVNNVYFKNKYSIELLN